MAEEVSIPWFNDFLGVAYRYYDLRMNIVPLFSERKQATNIWHEIMHWWNDHSIKIRFVETDDKYWFVMGGDSSKPQTNKSFFKILDQSPNYERFEKGHGGEAYLRLGTYIKKFKKAVKNDAVCDCGHIKEDHDEEADHDDCLVEDCKCMKFESFQVNLLKKKKTITDIKFLQENEIKDDSLAWNCLNLNKYKNTN